MVESHTYALGHDDPEIERLKLQARLIEGVTRRLIRACGVGRGMRALDIGCGPGDVAMLLAEAVGPGGVVVALDREPRVVALARERAAQAGLRQIDFAVGSDETLLDYPPFDVAIGRYVLIHQPRPAETVRRAAAAVRRGGTVGFHELALDFGRAAPPADHLYARVGAAVGAACRAAMPSADAGTRLVAIFEEAGLGEPDLIFECLAGGPSSPVIPWLAATYRAMLPLIRRLGLEHQDFGDPDGLAAAMRAAAAQNHAQIVSPPQACAWARRE